MASAFTHAFVAGALTPLVPRTLSRPKTVLALVGVSILPDLDIIAFPLGVPYGHPLGHRGLSHSLVFAIVMAVLVAWGMFREVKPLSTDWMRLAGTLFLACASHGVLDACTDAGQGIAFFLPFSEQRFFFPWRPILTSPVDPRSFFQGRGVHILLNEIYWVWLPVSGVWGLIFWVRFLIRRLGSVNRLTE